MYDQREIILVPFPYSDLTGSKQRPALIISNAKMNASEDRICCGITSNELAESIAIGKNDLEEGKLPLKSWVKPQKIFTVNKRIIKKSLCKVNSEFHHRIISELTTYVK